MAKSTAPQSLFGESELADANNLGIFRTFDVPDIPLAVFGVCLRVTKVFLKLYRNTNKTVIYFNKDLKIA